jgi:signal transduction histidine kinase
LYVAALRNRLQRGQYEKVEETLSDLDQTARQTLKEMRLLLFEFRLEPQDNLSLVEQIQFRLEAVEQRAGVDAALELSGPPAWPQSWEAQLYPIVMEALNNALKHANADRVRVHLCGGQNWLELSICDNGSGFQTHIERLTGIGLQSMRERAKLLGGALQVESKIGEGTQICLRIGAPAGI